MAVALIIVMIVLGRLWRTLGFICLEYGIGLSYFQKRLTTNKKPDIVQSIIRLFCMGIVYSIHCAKQKAKVPPNLADNINRTQTEV